MRKAPPELLSYLGRRAGDTLRTVAAYDRDGVEFENVRGDLDREQARARARVIHEQIITQVPGDGVAGEQLGKQYASMHLREHALIIDIPVGTGEGFGITLDPEAGRKLTSFVRRCEELVHEHT